MVRMLYPPGRSYHILLWLSSARSRIARVCANQSYEDRQIPVLPPRQLVRTPKAIFSRAHASFISWGLGSIGFSSTIRYLPISRPPFPPCDRCDTTSRFRSSRRPARGGPAPRHPATYSLRLPPPRPVPLRALSSLPRSSAGCLLQVCLLLTTPSPRHLVHDGQLASKTRQHSVAVSGEPVHAVEIGKDSHQGRSIQIPLVSVGRAVVSISISYQPH
jgi:hypothetical protein